MKRKNTLPFWGHHILENVGAICALAIALDIVSFLMSYDEIDGGIVLFFRVSLPTYILAGATFWMFIYVLGFFKTYYPVVLSFQACRSRIHREMAFSFLATDLVLFLIMTGVLLILSRLGVEDALIVGVESMGLILIAEGFSLAFAVLYVRYGKVGGVICGLAGALFGGVVGAYMASGNTLFSGFMEHIISWASAGIIVGAGIGVFLVGTAVMHLVFRKAQLYV